MFRVYDLKDSKRTIKRIPPTEVELLEERPDERTLPYFSVVPEQVITDERYQSLDQSQKGWFWLFVIHALWKEGGRCAYHPGIIAKRMGVKLSEWQRLERHLLDRNILILSPDGFYLVQPELRTQYLMTLETNNNKRHSKNI